MTDGADKIQQPISPNPPRWEQNPDPASIHVPGLDTTAPLHDQIDQIEQLITIKLQKVDENFAKIHHVLANRVLPAVKRYAVGTEPIRESAKFWTSFYEQAAQIRIPTFEEYVSVNDQPSEQGPEISESNAQSPLIPHETVLEQNTVEHSISVTENSFAPGQHAYSSTPATTRTTRIYDTSDAESAAGPSWTSSIESPLVRLDREIRDLTKDDGISQSMVQAEQSSILDETAANETVRAEQSLRSQRNKGKGREDQSMLRSVLRQNLYSVDVTPGRFQNTSPLKFKGKTKTPIPKKLNPYLPPDVEAEKWDGVVDLSKATPRGLKTKKSLDEPTTPSETDESFDGLPPGMSPPVLMSPARPPRSSAELGLLKLGKTPMKEASARISDDLVREFQQRSVQARRMFGYPVSGATESSLSTLPTPPSLSRYNRPGTESSISTILDPSLDTLMRRVGLSMNAPHYGESAEEGDSFDDSFDDLGGDLGLGNPLPPVGVDPQAEDSDSDMDSLDEINNTAHPSAAFLMASQRAGNDDSFGSSNHSDDSLTAEDAAGLGMVPVHPFAQGVHGNAFEDDDSFDDDSMMAGEFQEETLFGVPPAQRLRAEEQMRAANQGQLRMLGEDLLQDTIGISVHLARAGRVEETPTPMHQWDRPPS
ncbi:hypothetical protein AMATHDRAFT_75994 [Amanita thiersii Skay4041]|uniref:DASH complex subunit ASK1 n=1 Tax=Amanita thiersii Skay4041 TaxID=703135 RepID=A0A2A9NKG9_9AGAR|nr:hypothetical protein AMATHDRAFT_75994 [Amanita thiersii Skay4041]